jgi:hypothetical protein
MNKNKNDLISENCTTNAESLENVETALIKGYYKTNFVNKKIIKLKL